MDLSITYPDGGQTTLDCACGYTAFDRAVAYPHARSRDCGPPTEERARERTAAIGYFALCQAMATVGKYPA